MNNLLDWAPGIAAEGIVRAPFANQESNAVHEADIADAATATLLNTGHEGRAYELNGPQTLTRREQARVIGQAIGREVRFIELTRDQARQQWIAEGMSPDVVDWLLGDEDDSALPEEPNEQGPSGPEPTAESITGLPARSLHQWARDHVKAFTAAV